MATRLYDWSGKAVDLDREIKRGGEGTILDLADDPTSVAKVYHKSVDREKIEKLTVMARSAVPELLSIAAWPTNTLHKTRGGQVVGILMPKITGCEEIHQLYSPAERKFIFPKADWAFLAHVARNCAAAFETVHKCGHIIGDVNQSGVLVSHNATVRLIDCDSFQVRSNGRLFHCVVGVPQYTPPELQGQSFDRVERTRNHDAFGLALLIFHLLFMGRHPFAGRYQGPGDMSIEKAISEGRFAFSSMAQQRQMAPPPYSLPLTVLPSGLAGMFERAFALPTNGSTRPAPSEWREAMDSIKKTLKTCTVDHGHRYPANVAKCPWCEIMREGGPNFFISVQVFVSGLRGDLPVIDFGALWKRIDTIPMPPIERPQYPPALAKLTPRPLPPEVEDQRLMFDMVRVVALLALVLAIIGFITAPLAEYVGIGLLATFGLWWIVLALRSKLRRELAARRNEANRLQDALKNEQVQWDRFAHQSLSRFDDMKGELRSIAGKASQLHLEFEQERRAMESRRREEQLREFLDSKFIRNYSIDGIGRGRLAILLSFNIETAADVTREKLDNVDRFGPVNIQRLLDWRQTVEAEFRFDGSKPVPQERIRSIVMKYRELLQRSEASLTAGANELTSISDAASRELGRIGKSIADLVVQARQANADLKAR